MLSVGSHGDRLLSVFYYSVNDPRLGVFCVSTRLAGELCCLKDKQSPPVLEYVGDVEP